MKNLTFMIVDVFAYPGWLWQEGHGLYDANESSVAESVRETGEESVLIQNKEMQEEKCSETKYILLTYPELGRFIRREMQFHR